MALINSLRVRAPPPSTYDLFAPRTDHAALRSNNNLLWALHTVLSKSQKLAIALDMLVMLVTVVTLLAFGVWVKRRYWERRRGVAEDTWDADAVEKVWSAGKARRGLRRKSRGGECVKWDDESVLGDKGERALGKELAVGAWGSRANDTCLRLDPDFEDQGDWLLDVGGGKGQTREERERWMRIGESVRAGYDGFRRN